MKPAGEIRVLYDFTRPEACPWFAINDVVMCGVPCGTMRMENNRAVFTGVVSLDHGGGFASVRSHPALWDLSDYTGIELTLRGDGRRYKLRLLKFRSPVHSPDRKIERRGEAYPEPVGHQQRPRKRRDLPEGNQSRQEGCP